MHADVRARIYMHLEPMQCSDVRSEDDLFGCFSCCAIKAHKTKTKTKECRESEFDDLRGRVQQPTGVVHG
jgi:hypothetical protein